MYWYFLCKLCFETVWYQTNTSCSDNISAACEVFSLNIIVIIYSKLSLLQRTVIYSKLSLLQRTVNSHLTYCRMRNSKEFTCQPLPPIITSGGQHLAAMLSETVIFKASDPKYITLISKNKTIWCSKSMILLLNRNYILYNGKTHQ